MKEITTTVYEYDELGECAKEAARDWYRGWAFDDEWWDGCYETAETAAKLLGITIRRRPTTRMDGTPGHGSPKIFFSGFCSQGDGACFEGDYRYVWGSVATVRKEFPRDGELLGIAKALQKVQMRNSYKLQASAEQRGHYYHSGCMHVEVDREDGREIAADGDSIVEQCLRDFADWIYDLLRTEYDYRNSDEQVAEMIRVNEYTFTESGRRFG